ncbi:hypothetical protein [Nocardia lijiangensis]|uniref:hypothetical protein n=1 Tax=Nocardia lijiangensis TaxID=299618 RepID=UPI003D75BA87
MTTVVTKGELDDAVEKLQKKFHEWKEMPDIINSAVDNLKWAAVANPPALAAYQFSTGHRDTAQEKLGELFDLFQQILDGISAPFTFVDFAEHWQGVAAEIRAAHGEQDRSDVSVDGFWKGNAKDRFQASRTLQVKAMTSVHEMADKVHTNFIELAKSGLDLYVTVFDKISGVLSKLVTAVEQTGSIVFSYIGAPNMVAAINDAISAVGGIIAATSKSIQSQMIIADSFAYVAKNPWGLPGDRWPESGSDAFDGVSENGKEKWEVA